MMAQYIEIKAANPDCLLFYRMGDFYEMFFDDAEVASRALGITLTKRGKHQGLDIPMCGVPIHAADQYLQRLIALGHRVAVCEQIEDPAEAKKRGYKAVVRRDVIRLVTPGTLTEDALLSPGRNNYLAAVSRLRGAGGDGADAFGLAWIDISTGEFRVATSETPRLAADLARIDPREVLVAEPVFSDAAMNAFWRGLGPAVTPLAPAFFDGATAEARLAGYFAVKTLDGFGAFSRAELSAAAAALAYVEKTQIGERPPLSPPSAEAAGAAMLIDAATRANLELTATLSGERRGSLLAAIDRTVTGAGARLLARRLNGPSTDTAEIDRRLDSVAWLLADAAPPGSDPRGARRRSRPRPRAVAADARPRRPARPRRDPRRARARRATVLRAPGRRPRLPDEIAEVAAALTHSPAALAEKLGAALGPDLPHLKRDGGFVRDGYNAELDEARKLRDESRRVIAGLQADYAAETGVRSLKVKHNNVLGYFIEAPAGQGERLLAPPLNTRFIHRQTMAGAVRFTTTELADLEAKIAGAADRALAIELSVFDDLVDDGRRGRRRDQGHRRGARRARCRRRPRRARRSRGLCPARRSRIRSPSPSRADGTRWWSRRSAPRASPSSPTTATSGRTAASTPGASGWSPARTWRASRRSSARTR